MSSRTPSDDFTPDLGSSYLMQNFDFDEEYGEGTLDGARLPEVRGLSGLPDGVVNANDQEVFDVPDVVARDEAEGFDLVALDLLGSSSLPQPDPEPGEGPSGIVDFSWMDAGEQDPSRLPQLDTNRVIPELQETWGVRTDGVTRIEASDLAEVRYQQSLEEGEASFKFSTNEVRDVLASAMRKSAMGVPLAQVKQDIVQRLGHEASRLAKAVKALEAEHGLAGNVYIRASAFPGLLRGKWTKMIKKHFKNARYLIACGDCDACKSGCSGNCACNVKLGKEAVASVPWDKAYAHYAPRLALAGRLDRTATIADKRLTLKMAFLRQDRDTSPKVSQQLPTHKALVDTVSLADAKAAFAEETPTREVVDADRLATQAKRRKAHAKIGQWAKAALLTPEEAKKLLSSTAAPEKVLKSAARIITARKLEGSYRGDGRLPPMAPVHEATTALKKHAAEHRVARKASRMPRPKGENIREVEKMLRWARQRLSEGLVGPVFNRRLAGKFSEPLIKTASSQLVQIRKRHEGLSGFTYVDAAAYATPKGLNGCERGAKRHRANEIPAVLAMSRCASCVSRSRNEAGDTFCQKYNKPLVTADQIENPHEAKERVLEASRVVKVASAPVVNPAAEFGLQNDLLDHVEVQPTLEIDKTSDFSFAGLTWDDD